MLRVSSVHCTSAVQEFLQTSRCTIAVNACQVSEAAEGSQGRLLLHIEWPTVANTTVYLLEMDLTSLETDFILPEMDFNSPEMDFTSLETDFTSPETDFTFFIFEVHFRWVKSIFNGYLQMDLTFSKHSIFDRLHPSEVYYLSDYIHCCWPGEMRFLCTKGLLETFMSDVSVLNTLIFDVAVFKICKI